jgi:hypothetical protein
MRKEVVPKTHQPTLANCSECLKQLISFHVEHISDLRITLRPSFSYLYPWKICWSFVHIHPAETNPHRAGRYKNNPVAISVEFGHCFHNQR